MFIIFGTRGMKHSVKDSEPITNSCPNCDKGSLIHKLYRRWFTLFFIPVIPLDVIDRFYECDSCKSAYNENVKNVLSQSQEEIDASQKAARKIYSEALIAAMTHMAVIDGDYADEEEREINDAMENFEEFKHELLQVHREVKVNLNKDNQVFNYLNEARSQLSSESLMNILAQAAVVLLADGAIEKEEEDLMKEYLIACGLPKDMYYTLIEKLKQKDMTNLQEGQLN